MADNSRVEIPKSLLFGMGGALVVCMLALAFLLGRSSAPPAPVAAATVAPVRVNLDAPAVPEPAAQAQLSVTTAAPPPPPPPVQQDNPPEPPAPPQEAPQPATVDPAAAPPAPAAPVRIAPPVRPRPVAAAPAAKAPRTSGGIPAGERAAIGRYLNQVNQVTAQTGDLGDPNQIANEVLQQSVNGDNSGINNLISKARAAQAQLRAITPPPAAKEHYQLLVKTTQTSVGLLEQLKKATSGGDMSGLTGISAQGQSMQGDATRLQELTQELKAKAAGG